MHGCYPPSCGIAWVLHGIAWYCMAVVVSHTNVPDIHSLRPNCGSSIEWHSRLSFNIQVLEKRPILHKTHNK